MAGLKRTLWRIEQGTGGYVSPGVALLLALNTVFFIASLISPTVLEYLWADQQIWRGQIWRPLSAAVSHANTMHWFWNMVGLFFFGGFVERHLGTRGLLLLALAVALIANVVHVAIFKTPVLGFSGIDYAIIVAFATIAPTARVLMIVIPMPAWVLATLFVGLDSLRFIEARGQSMVAFDVHLMGAAIGFLTIMGRPWWHRIRARMARAKAGRAAARSAADEAELDRLLAKVSDQGLPALTPAERKFLQQFSERQSQDAP